MQTQKKITDDQLVERAYEKLVEQESRLGNEAFSDITRPFVTVWRTAEILAEGGFRNLFERGVSLKDAADAYARIGATIPAGALHGLLELFPQGEIPEDYDERTELVDTLYRLNAEQIRRLEANYEDTKGTVIHQLAAWIRAHGSVFE